MKSQRRVKFERKRRKTLRRTEARRWFALLDQAVNEDAPLVYTSSMTFTPKLNAEQRKIVRALRKKEMAAKRRAHVGA